MIDRVISFSDYSAIHRRTSFDENCGMSVDDFDSLLAEYHFREQVLCQVERNGTRCKQSHQHGWLGRRKDGKEGLIGGDCAEKYFHASERFRSEHRRLTQELKVASHLQRLSELLSDRPAFQSRIDQASQTLRDLRGDISQLRNSMPNEIIKRLEGMAKTGNRTVKVQIQRVETNEKDKKTITWHDYQVGAVAGIDILNSADLNDLQSTLASIRSAAAEAVISRDIKEKRLKQWHETLDLLPQCEDRIATLEIEYPRFVAPLNLSLLCHLIGNHEKQRQVVTIILQKAGESAPTTVRVQNVLNDIHTAIREANANCDFRIP